MSELVNQLCRITAAKTGSELSENLRALISKLVWEHDLLDAPQWMVDLVSLMANGVADRTELVMPQGYPEGSSGLYNILMDIESEIGSLGIDDQGECWTLDNPSAGVSIFVSREHPAGDLVVLTPTQFSDR